MALLPKKLRLCLFDNLATKTMRFVDAAPCSNAKELVEQVYQGNYDSDLIADKRLSSFIASH